MAELKRENAINESRMTNHQLAVKLTTIDLINQHHMKPLTMAYEPWVMGIGSGK